MDQECFLPRRAALPIWRKLHWQSFLWSLLNKPSVSTSLSQAVCWGLGLPPGPGLLRGRHQGVAGSLAGRTAWVLAPLSPRGVVCQALAEPGFKPTTPAWKPVLLHWASPVPASCSYCPAPPPGTAPISSSPDAPATSTIPSLEKMVSPSRGWPCSLCCFPMPLGSRE